MSQTEDSQPDHFADETPIASAFVPPSINYPILLAGDSYEHYSQVPAYLLPPTPDTLGPPCSLGIDEAGRGPVLGPMVYGCFYLPISREKPLLSTTYRFDDSKVLTPAFRAQLMKTICTPTTESESSCSVAPPDSSSLHAAAGWAISLLSARSISSHMLHPTSIYNLNAQAMDATIALITQVYKLGVNVKEIYIDTIGHPAPYQKKLERIFPTAQITVAKKADSLYPVVSAASVVAKVTRDVALEILYEEFHGISGVHVTTTEQDVDGDEQEQANVLPEPGWGSGYPSDVRCTSWMKRNMDPVFGWGAEARFSWGTAKDMLDLKSAAADVTWPMGQGEDSSRMTDYFGAEGENKKGEELVNWFGTRVETNVL